MEKEKALTIDPVLTRDLIKADGRTPMSWCRLRGFAAGTINRIMAGSYPHQEDPTTEYQRILKALQADKYLVEASRRKSDRRAA